MRGNGRRGMLAPEWRPSSGGGQRGAAAEAESGVGRVDRLGRRATAGDHGGRRRTAHEYGGDVVHGGRGKGEAKGEGARA